MGRQARIKKLRRNDTGYVVKERIPASARGVPERCYLFEAWDFLAANLDHHFLVMDDLSLSELDKPGVLRCLAFQDEFCFKENPSIPWSDSYGDETKCALFYKVLADLIFEMTEALSVSVNHFYEFSFLSNKERYMGIGKKINAIGGMPLMLEACNFLPKTFVSEIDCCWDGIGNWRW
jgi:hypothetical protein